MLKLMFGSTKVNARKDNCSCVYSAYILKPLLSGRNLLTRIDTSVFVKYPRRLKALNFDNLIIHKIISYDQNISLIFYMRDGSNVRLRHPSCVYITAQRQYTEVQKMRVPLK